MRSSALRQVVRCALAGSVAAALALAIVALPAPHAVAQSQKSLGGGWLGVAMEGSKASPGVSVVHVVRASPAERSGLIDGDRITRLDGTAVTTPGMVSAQVAGMPPGRTVVLGVVRRGKPLTFSLTLGTRPAPEAIMRMELVGEPLPLLPVLKLASGAGPVAYPGLKGQVVLIDLFATWCGPCLQLGPYYQAMHWKYGAQGLTVLGISDEEAAILGGWAAKNGVGYTIASDPKNAVMAKFSAPALPSSILVDKHGVVRDVTVGFEIGQVRRIEQLVQVLLKEP